MENLEQLKYPIGKFQSPLDYNRIDAAAAINYLGAYPQLIKEKVEGWFEEQLETPYRPGGWTVKQLIHHIADSHMNAYIRFKLTLTESTPTIKPYLEASWAELQDSKDADIEVSLSLIDGIHCRWVIIINAMKEVDFQRKFFHPQMQKELSLWWMLALYYWHSRHHLAHIENLKLRNNW